MELNGNEVWEKRMDGEPPRAFQAFQMYRAMGYHRGIRECMEMNGIERKKYGTWSRWARLYSWKERASAYDSWLAVETEKQLLNERIEHRKNVMQMVGKFQDIVGNRLDTLDPSSLDADDTMDLLERSVRLDEAVTGNDRKESEDPSKVAISFVSDFRDV